MARRYVVSVAVGTVLAVAVTGCRVGGDAGPKKTGSAPVRLTAHDVVTQASQKTNQMRSFRVTMAFTTTLPSIGDMKTGTKIRVRGHGVVQTRPSPATDVTVSQMSAGGRSIGRTREILVGKSLYMQVPKSQRSSRKPWVRVPADKLMTSPVNNSDPTSTLAMLSASKDVREVGSETIGGVATTHYHGTCPLTAGLDKLDAKQRAATEGFYQGMDLGSVVFDLWLDGNRLPHKVRMSSPAGTDLPMVMTMGYSDFNTPTKITAPPPSQVADGSHLRNLPGLPT